jgi:phosphatidyl-N-methylethanolamine N-methyltransferase
MRGWLLATAVVVLSLERVTYIYIARSPDRFLHLCRHPALTRLGEPVAIVRALLYPFKAVQFAIFTAWCLVHGDGRPLPAGTDPVVLGLAAATIVGGQVLNWSVFCRLGTVGVFYGDRLGHDVPWCHRFPFSCCAHPQYVGVVLTIWGFFFGMRFPRDDWFVLPALETLYYAVGARLEDGWPLSRATGPAPLGGRLT